MGPIKILVKSPFSIFSGYGNDGYGMVRALRARGHDVYVQPQWVDVPIPPDLMPLFAKPLVPPFDLTINHWSPDNLGIAVEARRCTRFAVAWTMWEFSNLRHICKKRGDLRQRLKWYDLLLGYDQVTLDALAEYVPRHVPTGVLIGGYDSANWKPMERDWFGDQFGFGMHGALNNRKQPMLVLQSYLSAREEDPEFARVARLSFHTTIPPLFPELEHFVNAQGDKRVRIHMAAWDDGTLKEWYAAQHCLVYPSQGEGKNMPCLEFMSTGGTVIHTKRGGPEQWLSGDTGYEVPYTLTPMLPRFKDSPKSARVSADDLTAVMLEVFRNRGEARRRGLMAANLIPRQLDWSVIADDLFRRIRDLGGKHGETIYALSEEDRARAGRR